MGFSNTIYRETADNLIQSHKDRLVNNPYYIFSNLKPTPTTYYNVNIHQSTLDEASRQITDQVGSEAPLRYNKILNMQLYGIERMVVDLQVGEYGVESPIEGQAVILPNTVIPCVDDYFKIDYLTEDLLFRVSSITTDTLENGANFYKINFYLDKTDKKSIDYINSINLIDTFEYIPSNVGSNYATLIKSEDKELLDRLYAIYQTLRGYYMDLFYQLNIQTFVYNYDDMKIYDPYLVEFIIRNKLMEIGEYLYVTQAVHIPRTFSIEYDKTVMRNVEERNNDLKLNSMYPVLVHDPMSLLVNRLEDYYELSINLRNWSREPINPLDMDLFDRIINNNEYDSEDPDSPIYRNIIIHFMNNNDDITNELLDNLINLNYRACKDLYYEIPILLYIINYYLNSIGQEKDGEPIEQCYMTRQ